MYIYERSFQETPPPKITCLLQDLISRLRLCTDLKLQPVNADEFPLVFLGFSLGYCLSNDTRTKRQYCDIGLF